MSGKVDEKVDDKVGEKVHKKGLSTASKVAIGLSVVGLSALAVFLVVRYKKNGRTVESLQALDRFNRRNMYR